MEEIVELSEKLAITKPGQLYVMLGDSLPGFYVVKCLSSEVDDFTGRYMQQIFESESNGQYIIYKETKEKDKFMYTSLVSELHGVSEIKDQNVSFTVYSVDKSDIDDILLTVGEMGEIE